MSTYEPGTVAKVTLRRLMADGKPRANDAGDTYLAFWDDYNRQWVSAEAGALCTAGDFWHFDVRPLVVLDLDDPSEHATVLREFAPADSLACLSWLADQIEAQTKPPRIPEPTGFDSAVTARLDRSDEPRKWVRTFTNPAIGSRPWTDGNHLANWSDLVDPVLIRDGVEDES